MSQRKFRWPVHGPALMLFALLAMLWASVCSAGTQTTSPPLMHVTVNLSDISALRSGALYFAHRCEACHSIQGARLQELAKPLNLSRKDIEKYLDVSKSGYLSTIQSSLPTGLAKKFLNKTEPPDLTVIAKRRSPDWLYTYLNSFYIDPSRATGVNNVVFYNVSMPDVFATLQGLQKPVMKPGYRFGEKTKIAMGVAPLTKGVMTSGQFHAMTKDIVTFLYLVAHPHQQEREKIGGWVLIALAILSVITFLLYKLYWKNVIPPEGGRWWQYWKR